jgi:DNA integrity scanning protein DisA with diadenylate cyclase activity
MKEFINHFMWGYQPHFRVRQQLVAERIFQALDRRFEPEIFLVGVRDNPTTEPFLACVEPENDFWIESEYFNCALSLSREILRKYKEAIMFHSHPHAQRVHTESLHKRSIRDAICKLIAEYPESPSGLRFHVSYPAQVNGYLVCLVLGLQGEVIDSYYRLRQDVVDVHEYRSFPVPVSLIDAAVATFLDNSRDELLKADPGIGTSSTELDTEETIRAAGDRLVQGIVSRVDQSCIEGTQKMFRSCTTISSLKYERIPGSGRLVLARRNHPAIDEHVHFLSPTSLNSVRGSRKLLELTSEDLLLHTNSELFFGLVKLKQGIVEAEDLFEIQMVGHHHWELKHAGNTLMSVQYGIPRLPKLRFNEDKLRTDLPRIFRNISSDDINRLVELIRTAEREPHGTLLIVSEAASSEAERLKSQATQIKACQLTPDILRHLTTIDGAILLTPQAICHAIGAILDGMATANGDPGRGARFNSAIRYYEASKVPCMAIVVSEDGGVDFIPNPPAAIQRSEIESRITALKSVKAQERISQSKFLDAVDWLEKHRFYLTEEDCFVLNVLVEELEERLCTESGSALKIIRAKFTRHPQMQESLYYIESVDD